MRYHLLPALTLTALALGCSAAAQAEGLRFLPITEPGFKFQPSVALLVGSTDPDAGERRTQLGVALEFNCGLIQTADNRIRTSLQLAHASKNGLMTNSVSLSPRYMLPLGQGLSVGAGPSLGWIRAHNQGQSASFGAYGLSAGADYRMGQMLIGADLISLKTGSSYGFKGSNTALNLKVGVSF